jgi:hypothetical protein
MASSNKKRSVSTKISSEISRPVSTRTSSRTAVVEFNPDYSFIKKDLVRIAILAGSFFVILVVLSFILR